MRPIEHTGFSLVGCQLEPAMPELDDLSPSEQVGLDGINEALAADEAVRQAEAVLAEAKRQRQQARAAVPGDWKTLYRKANKIILAEIASHSDK